MSTRTIQQREILSKMVTNKYQFVEFLKNIPFYSEFHPDSESYNFSRIILGDKGHESSAKIPKMPFFGQDSLRFTVFFGPNQLVLAKALKSKKNFIRITASCYSILIVLAD